MWYTGVSLSLQWRTGLIFEQWFQVFSLKFHEGSNGQFFLNSSFVSIKFLWKRILTQKQYVCAQNYPVPKFQNFEAFRRHCFRLMNFDKKIKSKNLNYHIFSLTNPANNSWLQREVERMKNLVVLSVKNMDHFKAPLLSWCFKTEENLSE